MKIQPKPYINRHKTKLESYGKNRRLEMTMKVLDNGTPMPQPVEFEDIDMAFNEWVKSLDISFDDKKLPVFKLFSNQRIGEYSQTWKHLDTTGNLLLNFLTVTRDNNPKQGEINGGYYNIPGDRKYPMFYKRKETEEGDEEYEVYSVKQPFAVDFHYTLSLVTDKYELLNKVNMCILDKFKAYQCYVRVKGHPMSMVLDEIADESEYNIDDRKYYSQSYSINLNGYIIRKEDLEVTDVPHKLALRMFGGSYDTHKVKVKMDECECCVHDKSPYENKRLNIEVNFPICRYKVDFQIDTDFTLTSVTMEEADEITIIITSLYEPFTTKITDTNITEEIKIHDGDVFHVEIYRNGPSCESKVVIGGYTDEIIDTRDKESILDMPTSEEDLIVNT